MRRGERAFDFVLPTRAGVPTRFYGGCGGKLTALIFSEPGASSREISELASELLQRIGGEVELVLILRAPVFTDEVANIALVLTDPEGRVAQLYGSTSQTIFLLDPNLRVIERIDDQAGFEAGLALASAARIAGEAIEPLEIKTQAPVLLIPNALDEARCRELIAIFEEHGGVETGVERSSEGKRNDALDPDFKRRRDLTVTDAELLKSLTSSVGRRVIPEVQQAFAFKATAFEGFKIARYDASDGGHFRAHRDKLSPATAHRRFALTLNLNCGYEGGHLRFPEYGPHLYRPNAGDAVVFSCSLLHEATVVTRGSRFVLLSFLFDER